MEMPETMTTSDVVVYDSGRFPLWFRIPAVAVGLGLLWFAAAIACEGFFGVSLGLPKSDDPGSPLLGSLACFAMCSSADAQWKPEAEFPPLSPRKAERAALQRAQQLRPDVKKWHRESICLHESGDDAWFYLVRFWRGDIVIIGLPSFLDVPVLMDGPAPPATADP